VLFLKGIYGREIFETWYKMVSPQAAQRLSGPSRRGNGS